MALTPEGLEELEELKKLRERRLSAEGIEPTPLTKNEQNLLELIEMRRKFLEIINDPNAQEVKSGLPGDFLYKSDYFVMAKEFLENAATFFKLPQIADSFAKGLNEMIEEYNPSPDVTRHFNKIMNGGADPNEIKLNVQENIFKQLEKIGVTAKIDEAISGFARYLDKNRSHFVPMELPDGKFLFLDINRYDRDREQHLAEGLPLGPQKRSREQPDDEAQQNSKRLRPEEDKENANPQKPDDIGGRQQGIKGILRNANSPKELDPKPNVRFGPTQFSPSEKSWTQRTSDNRSGGTDGRSP